MAARPQAAEAVAEERNGPPAHTGSDGLLMHAVLVGLVGMADWA